MHRTMVEILAAHANASKRGTEHGAISVSSCTEGSEDITCDDCTGVPIRVEPVDPLEAVERTHML